MRDTEHEDIGYQPPPGYVTMAQAERMLRISSTTRQRLIKLGLLPVYRDRRYGLVRLAKIEDIERLMQPERIEVTEDAEPVAAAS